MARSTYSVIIQWSQEDQVYVVTLPEWGGVHTHGSTYEEAAKNAREVLESLVEMRGKLKPPAHEFMFPGPTGFSYDFKANGSVPPVLPPKQKKARHAIA